MIAFFLYQPELIFMKKSQRAAFILPLLVTAFSAHSNEEQWGIAAMYRTASIPFYTPNDDSTVSTFVPMMFFVNDHFYIDGTEGGLYLFSDDQSEWQASTIARMRFIDIPKSVQNAFEGDRIDVGGQIRYNFNDDWRAEVEVMTDDEFQFHSNYRIATNYELGVGNCLLRLPFVTKTLILIVNITLLKL